MTISMKSLLSSILTKDLLLNLEDGLRAEALKAFKVVRDHSGLKDSRRARSCEGQLRFRMMEERFEEICTCHGGQLVTGVLPSTDLKIFQPFIRFEQEGRGIILGMAAMAEPKTVPTKNKSRVAGVSLNYHLIPRLELGEPEIKINDVFVLLLASRHRERSGQIEEIAVGVVDSKYQTLLFYESLETFLGSASDEVPTAVPTDGIASPQIALKKGVKPFVPPEYGPDDSSDDENKDTGTE